MKITIDKKITDERFMEYCLNLYYSGYDPSLLIAFYGLAKSWLQQEMDKCVKREHQKN